MNAGLKNCNPSSYFQIFDAYFVLPIKQFEIYIYVCEAENL